jgi:glutamate-ammonia-ligase adenylyltransferase
VQLIDGVNDPLDIAQGLARVAEAAIQVLSDATIAEFKQVHGKIPESEFAILGLGRAGGGVLTHASDLDLVFLFSGDHSAESDGERAMGATRYYIRLCQRVTAALSVPTAEGALYEIDTRLRPSGEQGPPAASFDGFRRYQEEQAWTWEHMALTRARVLYGSPQARSALGEILGRVLTMKRDPDKLRANLLEMRATIAEHKLPKGTLDIKLARGGLVDLEFLVQFFQLRDGCALTPDLGEAVRALVGEGLLDEALVEAHDCMTRFLVAAQLFAPDSQIPLPAARETLAKACRYGEWEMVLSKLHAARSQVALAWQTAFDEILEVST